MFVLNNLLSENMLTQVLQEVNPDHSFSTIDLNDTDHTYIVTDLKLMTLMLENETVLRGHSMV